MPTRVFLLRHAETANPHVFYGAESDVGLSEKGRRQAEAIAEYLAALRPEVVISSGMRRARETVVPVARACKLTLQVEPYQRQRGRASEGRQAVSAFRNGGRMESDRDRGSPQEQERTGKTEGTCLAHQTAKKPWFLAARPRHLDVLCGNRPHVMDDGSLKTPKSAAFFSHWHGRECRTITEQTR
jgi:hypothetical protein